MNKLKDQLKKFRIIRLICIILIFPLFLGIGAIAPKSTAIATIFTILLAAAIITGLILDKKIKQIKDAIIFQKNYNKLYTKNNEKNIIPTISFYKDKKYNNKEKYDKEYNDKEEYNQELKIKQREYAKDINLKPEETKKYESKSLVSENEKYFLNIIENQFGQYYRIQPQVPLSSIVDKNKEFYKQYQNELYRTIDIGIFDKKTFEPLLMVEINDKTHKQANRHERDKKVREILNIANIPIITFYTNMPNKADYIINRIKKNLSKSSK